MFQNLWNKIKEIIQRMIGKETIEQAIHVTPAVSSDMINAMELWDDMYKGKAPWLHESTFNNPTRIVSLGLPAFIASEKARMATLEMKSVITTPQHETLVKDAKSNDLKQSVDNQLENDNKEEPIDTDKPTNAASKKEKDKEAPRIKLLNDTYQNKVLSRLRQNLEYGIAMGGMIIKPYVVLMDKGIKEEGTGKESNIKARIEVDFVPVNSFFPISFTVNGDITEAAFVQTLVDKDSVYRRVEYHKLEDDNVIIQNKAFVTKNTELTNNYLDTNLGQEIDLANIAEWKDLAPEVTIEGVDRLLFAYFKMPDANTIDPSSPLGISCYGRAQKLIEDADKQYSNLLWEFEATQAAIDIDRDALKPYIDAEGVEHRLNTLFQERLFRRIDIGDGDTYEPFLPQIRDENIINGLNTILTRIEDVCALSRGTLSTDDRAEASTATELKVLRQRSYSVNADIQKELERTLRNVIYIMNIYCDLYEIVPKAEYEVSFEWDDSILVDTNEELNKRIQLVQQGVYSKLELRMWYFGETEEQAKIALKEIEEENTKAIMANAYLQQQSGMMLQTLNNNKATQQDANGTKADERRAAVQQAKDNSKLTKLSQSDNEHKN